MTDFANRWRKWIVCLLLGATVMAVFWQSIHCNFLFYDDHGYVTRNPSVQRGLSWETVKWAFSSGEAANWHPLTWLSHALDCQMYGVEPAGHHMTSLLIHAVNAILLFLLLEHITGAFWASAWVAAAFALHPLRVESVAWVSERKDVLSSLFWLLTVGAYASYADAVKSSTSKYKLYYGFTVVFYAMALMSKAMVVTLPFVLLLLDYWPLGRLEFGAKFPKRLVIEKIPFFLMAAACSVVTFLVQKSGGAVMPLTRFPVSVRLANVPYAYFRYIRNNFWPSGLAAFYPHRPLSVAQVGGALCLLAVVTVAVIRLRRSRPYLAVGWFWFLGMLVPTIGLVQVSSQLMADRYSYLSSVGILIMLAWGARDLLRAKQVPVAVVGLAGGLAIVGCVILTPAQVLHWRDTRALFTWASGVTDQNFLAFYNLGFDAMERGDRAGAIDNFHKALATEADDAPWVDHSRAYNDLGYCYLQEGQIVAAVSNFETAIRIQPKFPEAYFNMGRAFLTNNQPDVAVDCFEHAMALDPKVADIHYKLANALALCGQQAKAIAQYSETLRLRPRMAEAENNLAWILATCADHSLRDGARAVTLARDATEQSHGMNPVILGTLAAAFAEAGKFDEATAAADGARQLALAQKNETLARVLEGQEQTYKTRGGGSHP